MYGGRPQLPPEVWRLRAEHLHQVRSTPCPFNTEGLTVGDGCNQSTQLSLKSASRTQVLKPSYEKEQGKRPLSAAQMLLLDNTRTQMRCALELAAQGDQAAARFALLKVSALSVCYSTSF